MHHASLAGRPCGSRRPDIVESINDDVAFPSRRVEKIFGGRNFGDWKSDVTILSFVSINDINFHQSPDG